MGKTVRVGCHSGFWGDTETAAPQLVRHGNVDYLVSDYLAEVTMSIMAAQKLRNPQAGYATDFVDVVMAPLAREIAEKKIKVITNAGGVNPQACRAAVLKACEAAGVTLNVAVVLGDDLQPRVEEFRAQGLREMDTGAALPARITSMNAYLGGFPIARALAEGADVVITGRCVDSAVTLAIAADAIGPSKVHAVMMPSQYTADISQIDAREEADKLGVRYSEIAIKPVFDVFTAALADEFMGLAPDTTEENIQARVRGTLLMALSNKTGAIVVTTGNKSEMGTGYATLYGDMAGGFAVLKDISKMLVYRLANYRNTISPVIPQRVITRAPSAELRPNQTDQDSLPPYEALDAIMEAYVEHNRGPQEIEAAGYARKDVERVVHLLRISEYKRRQSPVGIRITPRGFGKDWRYPITNKYRHRLD